MLINDASRFDGVAVIGVDEHVWRHTRRGDRYVTVIIDLTAIRNGTGPARLLDMVAGRSKAEFKTATAEELPDDAVAMMDPFHVVRLAGDALDRCRRRVQQTIHGHRGRKTDPLDAARRTLHTGADLLTDKPHDRLETLFAADEHVRIEATWRICQQMSVAYREPNKTTGRDLMARLIDSLSHDVPATLSEVTTVGRTLKGRAGDILAYLRPARHLQRPTEAINGHLEHLRGTALGFRNLAKYIARSLLETGGFRLRLHPRL